MHQLDRFQRFCSGFLGLELEPFQIKIAREMFSDRREALILLPRGNGKSTLLAAIALWHLLSASDPRIAIGAASREQAATLFDSARTMATRPAIASRVEINRREPGRVTDRNPAPSPGGHGGLRTESRRSHRPRLVRHQHCHREHRQRPCQDGCRRAPGGHPARPPRGADRVAPASARVRRPGRAHLCHAPEQRSGLTADSPQRSGTAQASDQAGERAARRARHRAHQRTCDTAFAQADLRERPRRLR